MVVDFLGGVFSTVRADLGTEGIWLEVLESGPPWLCFTNPNCWAPGQGSLQKQSSPQGRFRP